MARLSAAVAERAGEQLGLIRSTDLDGLGASRQQRRTFVDSGVLLRVGAGVFRHAGFVVTHEQRLLAAAWCAGEGAVVSHLAAAGVWRFDGIAPTAIEVSLPRTRRPRTVSGRVHHVRDLLAVDATVVALLPVTTPSRTLLDSAPRLLLSQLEEALDGACRRGQIYLPYLEWRLAELRKQGRPGVSKLDRLLVGARRERGEESWLESAFLRLVHDAGLPPPRIQVHQAGGSGRGAIRLDARYDEQWLVVEIDGHATHATRRQRQADAERDAQLLASGYRVVRFTYEDVVERPHYVIATLAMFLGIDLAA